MKTFLLTVFVLFSQVPVSAETPADMDTVCMGCTRLTLLTKKLADLKSYDEKAATPLINAATKSVKDLPVLKGGKLTSAQVLAVARLLAAAYTHDNDPDYSIIDGNLKLFQRNQKLFVKTFETFAEPDKEKLMAGLDTKLGEAAHGQDQAEPISKKSKPVLDEELEPIPQKPKTK